MSQERIPKVFVLGVGAQKCGTTWLDTQLSASKFFTNGGRKEFHVFTKLREPHTFIQEPVWKQLRRPVWSIKYLFSPNRLARPKEMRRSPELYFDHFNNLYRQSLSISHVGDITPAYSTLPEETLAFIRDGMISRGFEVKVIFLMRDPVERVWSQLRMKLKNAGLTSQNEYRQLKKFYKTIQCRERTYYHKTVKRLDAIFPAENIFYGFYETFFQISEIQRLEFFLNSPPLNVDFNNIVHASPKSHQFSLEMNDLLREIYFFYGDTYSFVRSRFGESVPSTWKDYQL